MSLQTCTADYWPGMHTTVLLVVHVNVDIFWKERCKGKTFLFLVGLLPCKHGLNLRPWFLAGIWLAVHSKYVMSPYHQWRSSSILGSSSQVRGLWRGKLENCGSGSGLVSALLHCCDKKRAESKGDALNLLVTSGHEGWVITESLTLQIQAA